MIKYSLLIFCICGLNLKAQIIQYTFEVPIKRYSDKTIFGPGYYFDKENEISIDRFIIDSTCFVESGLFSREEVKFCMKEQNWYIKQSDIDLQLFYSPDSTTAPVINSLGEKMTLKWLEDETILDYEAIRFRFVLENVFIRETWKYYFLPEHGIITISSSNGKFVRNDILEAYEKRVSKD